MAAFANDTLPDGWLACDGTAVSRTTYANLFSKIGTTYGNGDGSATFNLPNLTDKFIQGNNTAGTVKNAGLPNIKASHSIRPSSSAAAIIGAATGAMSISTTENSSWYLTCTSSSTQKVAELLNFDASRSSSVYGNSTTVQPPAMTMRFAIFAGHSALYRWIRQS